MGRRVKLKVTGGPYAIAFDDQAVKGKMVITSVTFTVEEADQGRVLAARKFELLPLDRPEVELLRKVLS
jgi:hypothetical protein